MTARGPIIGSTKQISIRSTPEMLQHVIRLNNYGIRSLKEGRLDDARTAINKAVAGMKQIIAEEEVQEDPTETSDLTIELLRSLQATWNCNHSHPKESQCHVSASMQSSRKTSPLKDEGPMNEQPQSPMAETDDFFLFQSPFLLPSHVRISFTSMSVIILYNLALSFHCDGIGNCDCAASLESALSCYTMAMGILPATELSRTQAIFSTLFANNSAEIHHRLGLKERNSQDISAWRALLIHAIAKPQSRLFFSDKELDELLLNAVVLALPVTAAQAA